MGQVTNPAPPGITVLPTDRQSGPAAGAGASGNRSIFLGAQAGLNSTQSDLVLIGNNAGDAGITAALAQGAVVLGSGSLSAYTGAIPASTYAEGGVLGIGWNVAPLVVNRFNGMVLIGQQVMENMPADNADISAYVVIGTQAMQNHRISTSGYGASGSLVVIGHRAARGNSIAVAGGGCRFDDTVIIGTEACAASGNNSASPASTVRACVVIGHRAGLALASGAVTASRNVIIGSGAGSSMSAVVHNVVIGANIAASATTDDNVMIGSEINCSPGTTGGNVLIGSRQALSIASGIVRSIVIGSQAGADLPAAAADRLQIETFDGTTRRSMMFGSLAQGNLLLGNTITAQRALINTPNGATNILQIPNGTPSGTNPTNSGYLYVIAGALRYVGSAGTNTLIAPA